MRQADPNEDGETESRQWEDELFVEEDVSTVESANLAQRSVPDSRATLDQIAAAVPVGDSSSARGLTGGRISGPALSHTQEANRCNNQVGSVVATDSYRGRVRANPPTEMLS